MDYKNLTTRETSLLIQLSMFFILILADMKNSMNVELLVVITNLAQKHLCIFMLNDIIPKEVISRWLVARLSENAKDVTI